MVQAILDGRKTMTRRVIKPQPVIDFDSGYVFYKNHMLDIHRFPLSEDMPNLCPYGSVGNILWVREKWRKNELPTGFKYDYYADDDVYADKDAERWKPSIHMPREACRIMLEITNIRVERLQDISEQDAISEGIEWKIKFPEDYPNLKYWKDYLFEDRFAAGLMFGAKESFKSLWQSINGPESWTANPWVWVIKFKRR